MQNGYGRARHDVRLTSYRDGKGRDQEHEVPVATSKRPSERLCCRRSSPAGPGRPVQAQSRGDRPPFRRWRSLALWASSCSFYRRDLLDSAFNQAWLTSLLLLDLVALVYHLWAVRGLVPAAGKGQQELQPGRRRRTTPSPHNGRHDRRRDHRLGTVVVHAGVASLDLQWQGGVQCLSQLSGCAYRPSRPARPSARHERCQPAGRRSERIGGYRDRAAAHPAPRLAGRNHRYQPAPSFPTTDQSRTGPRTGSSTSCSWSRLRARKPRQA